MAVTDLNEKLKVRSDRGAVLAEWVIVFPLLLFFLLSIAQLGFMINAKQTVTYAAYTTARALLVKGIHHSNILNAEDKAKKAAALACIGITGLANLIPYLPSSDPDIIHIAGRYSRDERSHADFLQRYNAALDKTRINIIEFKESEQSLKVKVEVLHDYELDFPVVNQLIATFFSGSSRYGSPHITLRSTVSLG